MPMGLINFPTISFEQANPFLTGMQKGLGMMDTSQDIMSKYLANQKAQQLLPYAVPEEQANIEKIKAMARYQNSQAQINELDAPTEVKKRLSEIALANAQADYQNAQAKSQPILNQYRQAQMLEALQNANLTRLKINSYLKDFPELAGGMTTVPNSFYNQPNQPVQNTTTGQGQISGQTGLPGQTTSVASGLQNVQPGQISQAVQNAQGIQGAQGAQGVQNNLAQQNSGVSQPSVVPQQQDEDNDSQYGIKWPKASRQDRLNQLRGLPTQLKEKTDLAGKQINEIKTNLRKMATEANQAAMSGQESLNEFNQYDALMDKAWETGTLMGHAPAFGYAQAIDNIIGKMSLPAITSMKQAVGSRVSIPEFQAALTTKPKRTWNVETRKIYKNMLQANVARQHELAQLYSFIELHPELGVDDSTAERIASAYSKSFPLVSEKGNIIKDNIGKWHLFVTPEAIDSIKRTGDYNGFGNRVATEADIQDTMKSTKMNRKDTIAELKKNGFKIEGEK